MLMAATTWSSDVKVWQLVFHPRTGEFKGCTKVMVLAGHARSVTSVAFNADATSAVTAAQDGTLRVWTTLGRYDFGLRDTHHVLPV